jgi:hypothetical protein
MAALTSSLRSSLRSCLSPIVVGLAALVAMVTSSPAVAQGSAEGLANNDLQQAQAENLRRELANHLHLRAYDLLDELVYGWTKAPPFATDTAVVVADVTVPFGFGSGLEALLENHLAELILKHPETRVRLAHCPACSQLAVHADKTGTVMSRGIDAPGVLARVGQDSGAQHALFLDVEAEGSALVLRTRITTLDDDLTIVVSKTLSSSTSSAALLRSGDKLVSAEQARSEYLDALQQRGPLAIPAKLSLLQFAPPPPELGGIGALPIVWLQTGAEFNINHARDWSGSVVVGGTYVPQLYNGLMVEARINRLLTGASASLTQPNLYGFGSVSISTLTGPLALILRDDVPNVADLLAAASGVIVQTTTWPAIGAGVDLRIGNRVGAAFYAQSMPTLAASPGVGRFLDFGLLQVHAIGGEVTLWF